jgi:hypothetical protein
MDCATHSSVQVSEWDCTPTEWGTGIGTAVAARSALALVGPCELLMMVIRGSRAAPGGVSGSASIPDPAQWAGS